jgi:hypothetical protein
MSSLTVEGQRGGEEALGESFKHVDGIKDDVPSKKNIERWVKRYEGKHVPYSRKL